MINLLLYLTSAIITERVFLPILEYFLGDEGYVNYFLHEIIYIFWMYPVYLTVTILSITWNKDIANEAYNKYNKISQQSSDKTIWLNIANEIINALITGIFLIQIFALSHIPIIGDLLTVIQTSWFWSMSSFDYKYGLEGINIRGKIELCEYNWEYMLGYGIIPSLINHMCSKYIGLAILSLLFPLFIITAIMSGEKNNESFRMPILYLPDRFCDYLVFKCKQKMV